MSHSVPVEQFTLPISPASGYIALTLFCVALGSIAIYAAFVNSSPNNHEKTRKEIQYLGGFAATVVWIPLFPGALWVCANILFEAMTAPASLTTDKLDGRTISAFFAALAALIAAPLLIWRSYNIHRQTNTAQQDLITDRISRAVEQLGAEKTVKIDGKENTEPNLEVRIGGLYALERIAQQNLDEHIQIMEIICAYASLNPKSASKQRTQQTSNELGIEDYVQLREDIGVSFEIFRRRTAQQREREELWQHARGLRFFLTITNSNFDRIDLNNLVVDGIVFESSTFRKSNATALKARGCNFSSCEFYKTNLTYSNFSDSTFITSNFDDCSFIEANFNRTIFVSGCFGNSELDVFPNLKGALLMDANFSNSGLSQKNISEMFGIRASPQAN